MRLGDWTKVLLMLGCALPAGAYYHYIRYITRSSPYVAAAQKFDLNALPNKTVTFFVSDFGPSVLAPNDSFGSMLGQIRQAAQAWNSVDTSDLRVAFGGLYSAGTPQNTPHGEIIFDDLPPGLLGECAPEFGGDIRAGPSGPFVPITRAVCQFSRDLTRRPGPSYTELFFTTAVHELGHGLGLQHTLTSSAMTTATNRATTRVKPIEADDVAGLSLLYPRPNFNGQFASISGRVTSGGQGIHMASVVALRPNGSAVSALTHPDGTYRIDGLTPDSYWIYVHPLPPASQEGLGPGDIALPLDSNGVPIPASGSFETLFYPGTRDPQQFVLFNLNRGAALTGIDFSVQRRSNSQIYDVSTYSFFGSQAVKPAFLNATAPVGRMVARGEGVTSGSSAAPGLAVQVLGTNLGPAKILAYGAPQTSLALDLQFTLFTPPGVRHVYFTVPNDAYVLPGGVNLVQKQPPSITFVGPNPDGTVTIAGSNLSPDSRVYFDSLPATVRGFAGTEQLGTLIVVPPVGYANQQASVTVSNPDGQSSAFLQQVLPVYSYAPTEFAGPMQISPGQLAAGATGMIEVTANNAKFAEGQTALGLGSADMTVRRIWVVSPTHLLANVTVQPGAVPAASTANVITGFQVLSQPFALQVTPSNPRLPSINLPLTNAAPGQPNIYPGAVVILTGTNLSLSPNGSGVTLTLNDQPVPVAAASPAQMTFQVPASIAPGPAILRLNNGLDSALPVVIQIDSGPLTISGITSAGNIGIDASHPAQAGTMVKVLLKNLDPAVLDAPDRLHLNENGVELTAVSVSLVPGQPNVFEVEFVLSPAVFGPQVAVAVSLDGLSSNPIVIPVLAKP